MLMMRRFKATRLAGLILLALSLVAGWQVTVIPSPPVYAEVGPHLVPGVSAVFLTLLALAYLLADRQGLSVDASDDPDERPHEGANKRLLWYGLGLLALIVLIPIAGLGPACAFAFAGIAKAFDSRRTAADLAMGAVFTTLCWLLFAKGLGVQLGPLVLGLVG